MPSVLHHYSTSRPVTAALCPVNPIEGLSWVDQQQHWSRWQCATPKKPVNSGENTEKSKINSKKDTKTKELRQQVSNFLRRGIVDVTNATAETDQSMWLEHTEHRLDAVVGHILHSADEGSLIRTSGAIESSSVERTFATSAPGLLPLLNVLRPISNEPKQAIHLRMTPSPWTPYGLNGVAAFPQIEMQILFHPLSQMPFLHKLEAIIDERVSDIMLPQDVADLRFINRTSLRYAAIESDQNLAAFLANANLKVTGTGRLGAPPTLKMRIPRKALREDSTLAKETPPEDGSQDVEMEYLFAGLDFRDYIEYNLHDYALTYTRIEGGITGGRRGELSLHRTGMEVDRTNSNDEDPAFYEEFSRFFEAAFSLVQALDNKGTIQKVREVLYRLRRTKPQTKDEPAESGGEAGPVADSGSGGNGRRYEGWSEGLRPQE